jgi:hypothetical protein
MKQQEGDAACDGPIGIGVIEDVFRRADEVVQVGASRRVPELGMRDLNGGNWGM